MTTASTTNGRPVTSASADEKKRPAPERDLDAPEYYLNRELTWLSFVKRVLHEAHDTRTPLLERVKFLAITGSILDEFFMKRIGGLKQQVAAGVHKLTVDGRSPIQQIEESHELIRPLNIEQQGLRPTRLFPRTTGSGCATTTSRTSSRWLRRRRWTPPIRSRSCRTCH